MWASDHAAGTAIYVTLSVLLIHCTSSTASSINRSPANDAQNDGLLKILASNLQHQQQHKGHPRDPPYSSHGEFEDTNFSLQGASRIISQGFFTRLKNRSRSARSTHHSGGCPVALDGLPLFRCPSTRSHHFQQNHNVVCIDDTALCDGRRDCPGHEDEDKAMCLFYRVINKNLDILFMAMRRQ